MSNGVEKTNSEPVDDYEDYRFQDAAQTIFCKYRAMGMVKSSDGIAVTTTTSTVHLARHRQETIVRSRACTIS